MRTRMSIIFLILMYVHVEGSVRYDVHAQMFSVCMLKYIHISICIKQYTH